MVLQVLFAAFFLWYAGSAACNSTSRILLQGHMPSPLVVCCSQFAIATFILWVAIRGTGWIKDAPLPREAYSTMKKLSFVYALGFLCVNIGYALLTVSLAETLRSAEPLFSAAFTLLFLKSERVSRASMASLIPIVVGGALASASDSTFSAAAFACVTVSNACFAARSILTKRLAAVYSGDAANIFFRVSALGAFYIFALSVVAELLVALQILPLSVSPCWNCAVESSGNKAMGILLFNALAYTLYNSMSYFVLSKVSVVTHAVGNAFRRVVTIFFSVWYLGNVITATNATGIAIATAGVVAYAANKGNEGKGPAYRSLPMTTTR